MRVETHKYVAFIVLLLNSVADVSETNGNLSINTFDWETVANARPKQTNEKTKEKKNKI